MDITALIPNIGVAGFAIWVMYLMYDKSQKRMKEKDEELRGVNSEFRESLRDQLAVNTKALTDNTKILDKLHRYLFDQSDSINKGY